jgi:hypothetical protein
MVDLTTTTPARALETGQLLPFPTKSQDLREAFVDMTYKLNDLVDAYQAAHRALFVPDETPDADAICRAHAALDRAAQAVTGLPSGRPSDRSLQMTAFLLRLSIGMEATLDRQAVEELTREAHLHLLLRPNEPDAGLVNPLLDMCFALLDHLTDAVDVDEMPPEERSDPEDWDAALRPV